MLDIRVREKSQVAINSLIVSVIETYSQVVM